MIPLVGKLEDIYKAIKDLNITPLIADYDDVCLSEEDYDRYRDVLWNEYHVGTWFFS